MNKSSRLIIAITLGSLALMGCKSASHDGDTTTTETTVPGLEQSVVWPAADVVFKTPEEAATDFVRNALHVKPHIGEFQAGDSLSGEIDVYSPESELVRGTLLLRKLGPNMSWFVTAAVSDFNVIVEPAHQAMVPQGTVTVAGRGRGFEAQLHLTAIDPANGGAVLDEQFPMGGSADDALPFTSDINLSNVKSGSTVTIILQGGVGLEDDPGDFCAIVVTIG